MDLLFGLLVLFGMFSAGHAASNTNFYLFTRSATSGTILNADTVPLNFDRTKETYVLVHGLRGHYQDICISNLASALLSTRDVNIIIPNFPRAALAYTMMYRTIGSEITSFLRRNAINPLNTVVIGMSLGAQIAGILHTTNFKPALVIGLDPAGPQFSVMNASSKLSPLSADSVQVIHTNAGGLGTSTLDGHSDVFINRGTDFPCCNSSTCSHIGSCHWMSDTIRRGPVVSVLCSSQLEATIGRCSGPAVYSGFGTQHNRSTPGRSIAHVTLQQCVPTPTR